MGFLRSQVGDGKSQQVQEVLHWREAGRQEGSHCEVLSGWLPLWAAAASLLGKFWMPVGSKKHNYLALEMRELENLYILSHPKMLGG